MVDLGSHLYVYAAFPTCTLSSIYMVFVLWQIFFINSLSYSEVLAINAQQIT